MTTLLNSCSLALQGECERRGPEQPGLPGRATAPWLIAIFTAGLSFPKNILQPWALSSSPDGLSCQPYPHQRELIDERMQLQCIQFCKHHSLTQEPFLRLLCEITTCPQSLPRELGFLWRWRPSPSLNVLSSNSSTVYFCSSY